MVKFFKLDNSGQLKFFVLFLRPYWLWLLVACVALIVTACMTVVLGQSVRHIVDIGFSAADVRPLDKVLYEFAEIAIVLAVGTCIRFFTIAWTAENVIADIRNAVFAVLLDRPPAYFEKMAITDVQSRLGTDLALVETAIATNLTTLLRNSLIALGSFGMLIYTSPKLTITAFSVLVLILAILLTLARGVRQRSRNAQIRIAEVLNFVDESLKGLKIVQAYIQQSQVARRFDHIVAASRSAGIDRVRYRTIVTGLAIAATFSAAGLLIDLGGRGVISGSLTPGAFAAFLFYAMLAATAGGSVAEALGDIHRALGAAERVGELLLGSAHDSCRIGLAHPNVKGDISFDRVSFSYPSRAATMYALKDITFHVRAGQTVAIVGASGAGKTTLFNLLLRYYEPSGGRIKIDGIDIGSVEIDETRSAIAFVPQDVFLFSASMRDNVRFARPDADDEEVLEACRAAHVLEFMRRFSNGLDTQLSNQGELLSGGERQRVALARAFLAKRKILLLDEATSALDPVSEEAIRNALASVKGSCSVLIIAHRLAMARDADVIVVMDEGEIRETGTHTELMSRNGTYSRMFALGK